jgi:hypothetical protein
MVDMVSIQALIGHTLQQETKNKIFFPIDFAKFGSDEGVRQGLAR